MTPSGWIRTLTLALSLAVLTPAEARPVDWDDASMAYDRCATQLRESRMRFSDLAAGLRRVEAVGAFARAEDVDSFQRFLEEKGERSRSLQKRIDRTGRLFKKVGADLEKERKKGGSCPDCIISALNLLKGAVEDLLPQIAEEIDSVDRFQGSVTRLRDVRALVEGGRVRVREATATCRKVDPSETCSRELPRANAAQAQAEDSLVRNDEPAAIRHAFEAYEAADLVRRLVGEQKEPR